MPPFDAVYESPRENLVYNFDEICQPLQDAHDNFTLDIHTIADNRNYRAYRNGTKGIVSAAGGHYMPTFVVTLRMLRRTGSTLPVELFMRDYQEYEPYVCEVVLPPLNARCIVLSEILPVERNYHDTTEDFQLKSFAILFSSFESILWMDADCIPVHDPAQLLTSKSFTSTGLVTWPDFWTNTASPLYFQISRQPEPPTNARPATEAGAATAIGEEFYTVSEPIVDWSHPHAPTIRPAMLQADPIEDYERTRQENPCVKDHCVTGSVRGFFIHAHDPEFNPGEVLLEKTLHNGKPTRIWTNSVDALQRIGYDAEKVTWEETKTVACTLEHALDSWKDRSGVCEGVKKHWDEVFTSED
ncbi:hypothetical protein EYZ11_003181 [Aspergillus tanneri]|uniref:Nucleotide-diphospho-sugar transferase n=1 Tax=Aspergillus tanneri TaxID=1220188 RepID=A0A4S3JR42_9EURO|nr:hypothetical protein EYZ11_003181 [Aspergillus tanneri]